MQKIFSLSFVLIICLLASTAYSGGMPRKVKIVDLKYKGNDEFKIVFEIVDNKFRHDIKNDQPLILHVKKSHPLSSNSSYDKCINELLQYYRSQETFAIALGFTLGGPLQNKTNEFQSSGLFFGRGFDRSVLDTITFLDVREKKAQLPIIPNSEE